MVKIISVMDHFGQKGAIDPLGQFDPLGILGQSPGDWRNATI
jgi:hypothetical protein